MSLAPKTDLFDRKLRINGDIFLHGLQDSPGGCERPGIPDWRERPAGLGRAGDDTVAEWRARATSCRTSQRHGDLGRDAGIPVHWPSYYVNAPGTVKGAELEFEARPFDRFSIGGSFGYSNFDSPISRRSAA